MEVVDSRAATGGKVDPEPVEINGSALTFQPGFNKVLIRRNPPPPEGLILKPEIASEQSERGVVVAVGVGDIPMPPVGSIAKFSKYAEEIYFDDEGADRYVIAWVHDVRGWHG